ncbi:hypothetical protein 2 [Changjiang picorna-like virus 6]|uniref:hypothetical protein 2 n=1 Tax=Changjiang picorna-like virus 6 TaxID=1922795 RepID=UPI0009097CEB|nr:hypothetical protein 2 [Changjiang picorna-like virus 6]APG79003.1 hypothetical protein 2 [Changjiang picorna-like virus 6]
MKTTAVTMFQNEADVCAEVNASANPTIVPDDDIGDLKKYLSRPFPWRSGSFTASPGAQETFNISSLGNVTTVFGQGIFDKMEGALGFRATFCFKVVVTATPFHQGVAAISFQYGNISAGNNTRGSFYYLAPNLPHVKLDIAEQTSATLKVPFISACEYWPLKSEAEDWNVNMGTFAITRLTSFRLTGTQTAPRYTVYTWLEDVELVGAYPYATKTVTFQAGLDAELRESKLVSRGLTTVSKIAGSLTQVPIIGPIAGHTAWFSRLLSGAASSFGYSRPVDETVVRRKMIVGYAGESHVDMPSSSFKATPFQTNKLAVGKLGGNGIDEMSFEHILAKPSYIYRKQFDSTGAVGDLLYCSIVSPSCFWYRDNVGTGNIGLPPNATLTTSAFAPSTIMYLGSNFRYWRGKFRYHIKFSKTKMHGGRVLLSFTPSSIFNQNSPITTSMEIPDSNTAGVQMTGYSKMFDLRDGSEVEFDIPFTCQSPYQTFTGTTGVFAIQIISPLNSPTNASDIVDMMVSVSALPGFEFSAIMPSLIDGVAPNGSISDAGVYKQAGGATDTSDASMYIPGEKYTSVKQLMMIPDWHIFDQANATTLTFTLGPWFKKNYLPNTTGTTPIGSTATAAYYGSKSGRMQDLFAFANGSAEYTVITDKPDAAATTITVFTSPNDTGNTFTAPGSLYQKGLNEFAAHTMFENRGSFRVCVPSFTKYQRVPAALFSGLVGSDATAPSNYTVSGVFTAHVTAMRVRNNSLTTTRVAFGKAAGDDATVSQFIGPPLCNFFQATAANSPNPSTLPF